MTKSDKQSWEQERAKGYTHFLLHSLLRNGLLFGIVMTLGHILLPMMFRHQPMYSSAWQLLVMFGFYVLSFGAGFGAWMWRIKESDYQKQTETNDVA